MPKIEETTFKHLADKILRAKVGFRIINDEINRKEQNSNQPTTSTNLDSLIAINENDLKEISTFLEYDEEMSNSPIDNIIPTTNQQCVRPIFCKERISKKNVIKNGCIDCNATCLYTIHNLLNQETSITQKQVRNILKLK